MTDNQNLTALSEAGVSIWLDDLSRQRITSGNLAELINDYAVVGVTSNPTIFAKALSNAADYNDQIRELAARGEPVDLSAAEELLEAMDDTALSPEEFLVLDAQFHLALAQAAGNQVITAMMAGLRDSIEDYTRRTVPLLESWAATSARLRTEHRGVLDAVRTGDPDLADARITAHIKGYYADGGLHL